MSDYNLNLDKNGEPTSKDLIIVSILLLVKVAQDEKGMSGEELAHIVGSVTKRFDWKEQDVGEAISVAQFLLKEPEKVVSLIDKINEKFSVGQKQLILSLVWRVIEADKKLTESEVNFSVELRKQLKLSLEQAVYARSMAEDELSELVTVKGESDAEFEDE